MGRNISENEAVVGISINPNYFRQSDAHSTSQRGVGQPQQTAEQGASSHPTQAAVPPAENLVLMFLIALIKQQQQQQNHDPLRV